MNIEIYGTKFNKLNYFGDFNFMCNNEKYNDSLFLFNDNEEQHNTCIAGGGNAIIRQFNKYNENLSKPRSAGIPTGTLSKGGYKKLNESIKSKIDNYFEEIIELFNKYHYESIYYSVGSDNKLGTSIFKVDQEVIDYIDEKIHRLSDKKVVFV